MPLGASGLLRSAVVELLAAEIAAAAGAAATLVHVGLAGAVGSVSLPGLDRDRVAGGSDPLGEIGGGILARSARNAAVGADRSEAARTGVSATRTAIAAAEA